MRTKFATWQSNQAVERKGTRLFWFRTMTWKDARASYFETEVERQKLNDSWILRTIKNWLESTERQSRSSGIFSQDTSNWIRPMRFTERWHKTDTNLKTIWRLDYLHVHEQISWSKGKENFKKCVSNSTEVKTCAHRLSKGHWSLLDREHKKSYMGRTCTSPKISGFAQYTWWYLISVKKKSGHPVFRTTSALDRGFLKSVKGGKLSTHCDDDLSNAKLLFRAIIFDNQLRVYGAMSDRCGELTQRISDHTFSSTEKCVAKMEWTVRLSTLIWRLVCHNESVCNRRSITGEICCNVITRDSKRFQRTQGRFELAKHLISWERFLLDREYTLSRDDKDSVVNSCRLRWTTTSVVRMVKTGNRLLLYLVFGGLVYRKLEDWR